MKGTDFRDAPDQAIVGSGGVVAPAADLARWVLAQEQGRPNGVDFVTKLRTPIALTTDQGRNPLLGHYAAGLFVRRDAHGNPVELRVSTKRVRGIVFSR
jgi:hypothetical protein